MADRARKVQLVRMESLVRKATREILAIPVLKGLPAHKVLMAQSHHKAQRDPKE